MNINQSMTQEEFQGVMESEDTYNAKRFIKMAAVLLEI